MKTTELNENRKSDAAGTLDKGLEQIILEQVMKTPQIELDPASLSELAVHIQKFLQKKQHDGKNRNDATCNAQTPSNKKGPDSLPSEVRDSLGKSTGRTQVTEVKRPRWIWKGREETNPSQSLERDFMSRDEIESFINTEEMKGIQDFQRKVDKGRAVAERGVRIGATVKKKNRYSVPVKRNVFKHEHSMIEEESEDSAHADAPNSKRTLEESLKVLKGHLVHEIESQKQQKTPSRPRLNLYSNRLFEKLGASKASLDSMVQDTLFARKKTPEEAQSASFKPETQDPPRNGPSVLNKQMPSADRNEKEAEPQTRELFFQQEPLVRSKRLKKCKSLQKPISFCKPSKSVFEMSPTFNGNEQFFEPNPNFRDTAQTQRPPDSDREAWKQSTWTTTGAGGSLQATRKRGSAANNVFDRLFKQARNGRQRAKPGGRSRN